MLLELSTQNSDIKTLISPFYVLYDLRVAYSHLGSQEGAEKKLQFIKERLDLPEKANLYDIYNSLIVRLQESFRTFTKLINKDI